MAMAAITMKSATICTILLSLHAVQANRTPFLKRGAFTRPGWRSSSSASTTRSTNTALVLFPRGGDDDGDSVVAEEATADPTSTETATATQEESLDDRVNEAMRRLGLRNDDNLTTESNTVNESSPPPVEETDMDCEGGVCTLEQPDDDTASTTDTVDTVVAEEDEEAAPTTTTADIAAVEEVEEDTTITTEEEDTVDIADAEEVEEVPTPTTMDDIYATAELISTEMSVPQDIALAAIYSSFSGTGDDRQIDEEAARYIVQSEVDAMTGVAEDCPEVTQLVEEGYDAFFVRRSLAFSDMNVDNARAILLADREDEEAERRDMEAAQAQYEAEVAAEDEPELQTVTVDFPKDFDPATGAAAPTAPPPQQQQQKPPPAKKEDVIFEGTVEDLQKLVLESPVPVLLDVYADWCGPCKQLTPALEQICINAGGMLRLVKINTDQQRQISGALEVKALPTIFGVRDGKIINSFQGMPRDEQMIRDFLIGTMVPGQNFKPPLSDEDKERYDDLSIKLLKVATSASFSFSAREGLDNRVSKLLDELVATIGGDTGMAVAEDSAQVLRSLMANVIEHPFEEKFRTIKLDNKVIASKIAQYPPCLTILKSIGFAPDGESRMVVAKGKRVLNIAPFVVGRGSIEKWIDKNRSQIATEGRKRRDEIARVRLAAEAEEAAKNRVDESEEEEESEDEVDANLCVIKLRLEGKKKVHDIEMDADDTLAALLDKLPFSVEDGETVQFTCVAKRLIVKSTDTDKMSKTLSELRLMPTASVVVKIGEGKKSDITKGSLAERAAAHKKKTTGSHSYHSIGLYAKDDGDKAETFESGGVLYEHVLTDDEDEGEEDGGDEEKGDEADENEEEEADDSEESMDDEDEQ